MRKQLRPPAFHIVICLLFAVFCLLPTLHCYIKSVQAGLMRKELWPPGFHSVLPVFFVGFTRPSYCLLFSLFNVLMTWHRCKVLPDSHILPAFLLRNSASSIHWLSSTIFPCSSFVVRSFVRPASVTSPLISTIWCFRPYTPYIF